MEILVATQNPGKVREIEKLPEGLSITLLNLKKFEALAEPAETGSDFMQNAVLKARYYALQTGLPALADDSGLEVAVLGGAPGIFSARYAGENAGDSQRIEKLLGELKTFDDQHRTARFVCAVAFVSKKGEVIYSAEGICDGKIADMPRGTGGFGYDPIFVPEGFSQTFGEMAPAEKQEISHRARAIQKIITFLRDYYTA